MAEPDRIEPEGALRLLEVATLEDHVEAARASRAHGFWHRLVPSAGATLLSSLLALLERGAPTVLLALGFLLVTLLLVRGHRARGKGIEELEGELARRLEGEGEGTAAREGETGGS